MISALMIDTNEIATAPWIDKLTFAGAPKMVTKLEHGDIWATTDDGDMVCIERKTPSDLLNSIKDKHIFKQVAGMRARTPFSYVVVTGILTATSTGKVIADERVTGWDWNAVQGALIDVQEMGVRVVQCISNNEYEPTVLRLCGRERGKEKVIEPTATPRIMSPGEVLLCSLPGIGWERAQALLAEFENRPAYALAWLTWTNFQADVQIAGIGKGIKNNVRHALGLGDVDVLEVLPDEKWFAENKRKVSELCLTQS